MAAQAAPVIPRPNPVKPIPPPLNSPERRAMEAAKAQQPPPAKVLPKWRRTMAAIVPWLLAVYLCGMVIQVMLAGYGLTELGHQGMDLHMEFAHVIELLPLLILIVGFLGADKWGGIGGIALLVMFQLQYVFLSFDEPIVRALHPTNAVLMLLLTLGLLLHRPMWSKPMAAPVAKPARPSGKA